MSFPEGLRLILPPDLPTMEWTRATEKPIDGDWLKERIESASRELALRPAPAPGSYWSRGPDVLNAPLRDTNPMSLSTMIGLTSSAVVQLLGASARHIVYGGTVSDCVFPWIGPKKEPCGTELSAFNLTPEWLRHFLGVFYNRDVFEKFLGTKFFPFENRDHFLHSLLVLYLGYAVLGAEFDEETGNEIKQAMKASIGGCKDKETDPDRKRRLENFEQHFQGPDRVLTTVEEWAGEVYRLRSEINRAIGREPLYGRGTDLLDWLRKAWASVALWHDTGYDSATWYLLTTREFSHCKTIRRANAFEALRSSLEDLAGDLGEDLLPETLSDLRVALENDHYRKHPYYFLWQIEQCDKDNAASRPWGRFHALLSAYEFLRGPGNSTASSAERGMAKLLASAIARHHEPRMHADMPLTELAKHFVSNPLGELLHFCDHLATIQRVKVDWGEGPTADLSGGQATVSFRMQLSAEPITLGRDPKKSASPWWFWRGHPFELPTKVVKRGLWGSIVDHRRLRDENESSNNPGKRPSCAEKCSRDR